LEVPQRRGDLHQDLHQNIVLRGNHGACGAVLGALLLLVPTPVDAHPVLLDRIDGQVTATEIILDVRPTLRSPLVAIHHPESMAYSSAELSQAVTDAAPYFASHVSMKEHGSPLHVRVVSSTIDDAPDASVLDPDLEKVHADYKLAYSLPEGEGDLSLEISTTVLDEFEYAPGQPWDQSFAVVVSTDPTRTASGVVKRSKPLSLTVPRVPGEPKKTEINYRRWLLLAAAALLVPSLWASARRSAKRARKRTPRP
jgi:hypothetical protein